jgi:hypothetical protein
LQPCCYGRGRRGCWRLHVADNAAPAQSLPPQLRGIEEAEEGDPVFGAAAALLEVRVGCRRGACMGCIVAAGTGRVQRIPLVFTKRSAPCLGLPTAARSGDRQPRDGSTSGGRAGRRERGQLRAGRHFCQGQRCCRCSCRCGGLASRGAAGCARRRQLARVADAGVCCGRKWALTPPVRAAVLLEH